MRILLKLKLIALIALWSVICLGLYAVLALVEALSEIVLGAAGAAVGQGQTAVGLVDLGGDIVQWGVGLVWLIGLVTLWYLKRLVTSRETRRNAAGFAVKAAGTAGPYVLRKHPLGRAYGMAKGPAGRIVGGLIAKAIKRR